MYVYIHTFIYVCIHTVYTYRVPFNRSKSIHTHTHHTHATHTHKSYIHTYIHTYTHTQQTRRSIIWEAPRSPSPTDRSKRQNGQNGQNNRSPPRLRGSKRGSPPEGSAVVTSMRTGVQSHMTHAAHMPNMDPDPKVCMCLCVCVYIYIYYTCSCAYVHVYIY